MTGVFGFLLFVFRPAVRTVEVEAQAPLAHLDRRLLRLGGVGLLVALASALAWLWLQAAAASGRPLLQALEGRTLAEMARPGREVATPGMREEAAKSWSVNGIVRDVPAGTALVIITHEARPGLMDAMTMAFRVADRSLIAGLQPGDRIRFTVVATDKNLFVVAIRRE